MAVSYVEKLRLSTVVVVDYPSVGQNPLHVEQEQPYPFYLLDKSLIQRHAPPPGCQSPRRARRCPWERERPRKSPGISFQSPPRKWIPCRRGTSRVWPGCPPLWRALPS